MAKTISEQIKDLQNTRAAKAARMEEVIRLSIDEDRSTNEAEAEEFDTLEQEIKQIDQDLTRLQRLEQLNAQQAKAVVPAAPGANPARVATEQRSSSAPSIIVNTEKEEKFKGQNYTRLVIAKTLSYLEGIPASAVAYKRWGKSNPMLVEILKANEVAGGGSGSGEWGAELVSADARYTGDFIEFLTSKTIFDKLPLREVPAHITIKGQDGTGTGYWVGESKAIPASAQDFSDVTLTPLKVGALAVISMELMRDSTPSAEMLVRDALIDAAAQRIDNTFVSTAAAVASVSPAGLLRQVSAFSSSGFDGDGVRNDIKKLYNPFITNKNASGLYFVMNTSLAKSLQLMRNSLGQKEFPDITQMGGMLEGDPVVTGDNVNSAHMLLLKPSDIYKIGDQGIQVSVSRDATVEMNSVPAGDTDTPAASANTLVSMFQTESVAIKIVRPMNFQKRRTHAVQYIDDATYGAQDTAS